MSLGFVIYLLGILDNLNVCLLLLSLFLGVGACVMVGITVMAAIEDGTDDESFPGFLRASKTISAAFLLVVVLMVCTPSSKTVAAMYLIPAITNSEQVREVAGNSFTILQKLSREWLDDLSDKEKK